MSLCGAAPHSSAVTTLLPSIKRLSQPGVWCWRYIRPFHPCQIPRRSAKGPSEAQAGRKPAVCLETLNQRHEGCAQRGMGLSGGEHRWAPDHGPLILVFRGVSVCPRPQFVSQTLNIAFSSNTTRQLDHARFSEEHDMAASVSTPRPCAGSIERRIDVMIYSHRRPWARNLLFLLPLANASRMGGRLPTYTPVTLCRPCSLLEHFKPFAQLLEQTAEQQHPTAPSTRHHSTAIGRNP